MEGMMKVGKKQVIIPKVPKDAVAIFRQTAKDMGKLRFNPHEAYEEEMEEKVNP